MQVCNVRVNFRDEAITDIQYFSNLTFLEDLFLTGNQITDIEPIRSLQLIELLLSDNPIADFSPLSSQTSIERIALDNTGVTSLEWAEGLEALRSLQVSGNGIQDIAPIALLPNLNVLEANDNNISDLSPLAAESVSVRGDLLLAGNQISDISPLAGLPLTEIDLSRNMLTDISDLVSVFNDLLVRIKLSGNQIDDISVFDAPLGKNLYDILINDNLVSDLSPLIGTNYSFSRDQYDFSKNRIEDVTPLASFGDFDTLDISDNLVTDLSPLKDKPLSTLYAARNRIRSLDAMLGVSIRADLDLTDNRISSVAPLLAAARAEGWSLPRRISLLGNPLDRLALEEHLPVLCDSGQAEIYFGDGETCDGHGTYWSVTEAYDPDPDPVEDEEAVQPVTCAATPGWLFESALPGLSRSGDLSLNESVPAEPTTVDEGTGLEWRRCSEGQTIVEDTCEGVAPGFTISEAAALCGDTYGGNSDWRVATVTELTSIVDYSIEYPGPTIDPTRFPGTFPGYYWGSADRPYFIINFYNGTQDITFDGSARVRCVRGGREADPAGRFAVSGDNDAVVVDTWTDRVWRRCAEGQVWNGETCDDIGTRMPIVDAETVCATPFAGYSDWRLPNIRELSSLINPCGKDPAAYSGAFPKTPQSSFWSATPFPDVDPKTWTASFVYGWTEPLKDDTAVARVRCVR